MYIIFPYGLSAFWRDLHVTWQSTLDLIQPFCIGVKCWSDGTSCTGLKHSSCFSITSYFGRSSRSRIQQKPYPSIRTRYIKAVTAKCPQPEHLVDLCLFYVRKWQRGTYSISVGPCNGLIWDKGWKRIVHEFIILARWHFHSAPAQHGW